LDSIGVFEPLGSRAFLRRLSIHYDLIFWDRFNMEAVFRNHGIIARNSDVLYVLVISWHCCRRLWEKIVTGFPSDVLGWFTLKHSATRVGPAFGFDFEKGWVRSPLRDGNALIFFIGSSGITETIHPPLIAVQQSFSTILVKHLVVLKVCYSLPAVCQAPSRRFLSPSPRDLCGLSASA